MQEPDLPGLEFVDDRLRRLFDYWLETRGARLFPARTEIDRSPSATSSATSRWSRSSTVLDRHHPGAIAFGFDGSILVAMSGTDYTGRYLHELPGEEYVSFVKETYDRVVDSGIPYRYRKNGLFDRQHFSEETLILPLGREPPHVDMLMVAVIPGDLPDREDGESVI